ncbi:MAG: hypothetical protein GEU80_10230, partial [Dehalococcoidia bacterium]|nr:hypothetical protein [Dehalococcoidia bacterium]
MTKSTISEQSPAPVVGPKRAGPRAFSSQAFVMIALSIALIAGCSDGAGVTHGTATATVTGGTATATAASTSTPAVGTTGIPAVDSVLQMLEAGDLEGLIALVEYQQAGCTTVGEVGGPPRCEPSEPPGTVVSVFPVVQCEGTFLRDARPALASIVEGSLYAVVELPATPRSVPYWPAGEYRIIVKETPENPQGHAIVLERGRIVRTDSGCMDIDTLMHSGSLPLPVLL